MTSSDSSESGTSRSFSLARLIGTLAVVFLVAAGAYYYGVTTAKIPREEVSLRIFSLDQPTSNRLAERFTDNDGDEVADPPSDSARLVDPDILYFTYLATEQDHYKEVWTDFLTYLGEKTGKPVEYVSYSTVDEQLNAIHACEVHVAGLNSGAVPMAVNAAGFVPVCSFGKGGRIIRYTMKIITPAGGLVQSVADLRGRQLALTNSTSNSGWKAPLALLMQSHQMQPLRDFDVVYSNGHAESILGVANKSYDAAAVASDELALALERGLVSADQFSEIYESEPFCNNVIGCPHNLDTGLAASIREALLTYPWEGSRIGAEFSAFDASQFVPVSYKNDLKLIRTIDNVMGRRHVLVTPVRSHNDPGTPVEMTGGAAKGPG